MAQAPRKAAILGKNAMGDLAAAVDSGRARFAHHTAHRHLGTVERRAATQSAAGTSNRNFPAKKRESGAQHTTFMYCTAANPYYPPPKEPLASALREDTRSAFAVSSPPQETDPSESVSCNRSRPIQDRLPTIVRRQHVASTLLRSARQPFRWSLCVRHHPLTRSRHPTALPVCRSIPAETSVAGFIDFYSGHSPPLRHLKHVTDRVTHRVPTRLPQRFLR